MSEFVEFRSAKISPYEADVLKDLEKKTGNEFSLTKIAKGFTKMSFEVDNKSVIGIKMWNCGFTALPEIISNLKSLHTLDLSFNKLSCFPESITNFTSLMNLSLNKTEITSLPDSIGNLKSLKGLFLKVNKLSTLPESIGDLKSLQILNLEYNQLSNLPESIGNITSLLYLYFENNKLTILPKSIGNLRSLIVLNLKSNNLSSLPESISNLKSLKSLDLKNNKLKTLPNAIINLEKKGLKIHEDLRKTEIKMMKCKICGQDFPALSEDGKCRICLQMERGLINIQLTQQQWSPRIIGYSEPNAKKNILNPDEIIIKDEIIKIEYTYPLSVKAVFEYKNKGGFSRMDLWRCIYNGYKKIYVEEEKATGDPGRAPGLLNRAESSGPYGIWGHDLGELHIERITYNPKFKLLMLFIGS